MQKPKTEYKNESSIFAWIIALGTFYTLFYTTFTILSIHG